MDLFGKEIHFTTEGKYKYNTLCGGFSTIICLSGILFYGLQLLITGKTKSEIKEITFHEEIVELSSFVDYWQSPIEKMDFITGFGLLDTQIDPRYGYFSVVH